MRIAFLSTSSLDDPSPRGRWLPLARELAQQGHSVTLLLLHHSYRHLPAHQRHIVDADSTGRVTVQHVAQMHVCGPIGRRTYYGPLALVRVSLTAALSLAYAAYHTGCTALHVCKPQPINGLAGVLAARVLRCPLYVDCDDYEAGGNQFGAGWQQQIVQLWEDRLPRFASGVTVNTRFLQQRYQQRGIPVSRMVYVPNGIAPARRHPPPQRTVAGLRAALGLDTGVPVVAYVGTLTQQSHNVGLLLDAFALVVQHLPTARLLLVGDGDDRTRLRQQAASLGIAARVLFVGAVPYTAVPSFLALAACSVDPADDDDVARARSPLKIVESMAAGVPVVTGNVGDRAETLAHGGAGVLVAPGSARALADGICSLLDDEARRTALAHAAHQQAATYGWPALAARWSRVYA